jgi:sec-independent protein translocase protein TatA
MPSLGIPELVIILVIVVLIFGAGRLAGVGRALGTSVKEFRDATRDEKAAEAAEKTAPAEETKA